jgi:hypothetical protein
MLEGQLLKAKLFPFRTALDSKIGTLADKDVAVLLR